MAGGRYREYTLAEKFEARIKRGAPDACWPVAGSQLHSGHVQLSIGSAWKRPYIRIRAHVYAWQIANGRIVPDGMVIMHTCDNPPCCNPRHLQLGTQHDNILDSVRKGRYNCFGRQKLNAEQVHQIRALAATGRLTRKDIGARFGVTKSAVTSILRGDSWAHLPFVGEQVVS